MSKKENKLDQEIIDKYFLYILDTIYENLYFKGKMFQIWRENGLETLEKMNDYWMVYVNLDRLKGGLLISSENTSFSLSENNIKTYWRIFAEIFKILQKNKFWEPEGTITKAHYLNNIQHFINNYSCSNKWNSVEKNFIKMNKGINIYIFETLVELKLIKLKLNEIEFDQLEISNIHSQNQDYLFGINWVYLKWNESKFLNYKF